MSKFTTPIELLEQPTPSDPAAGSGFIYPKSDKRWYTKDSDGVEREIAEERDYTRWFMDEEFTNGGTSFGTVGNQGWGVGAAVSIQAPAASHPGIVRLPTTSTINNTNWIATGGNTQPQIVANEVEEYAWILRVPTVTSIIVRLGLAADAAASTPDGAFFDFTVASSANWRTITRQGGTATTNTSSVAVTANNWYQLRAKRLSGGNWEFYINETLVFTHSTNLPTGNVTMGGFIQTTTAAVRNLDLDYAFLRSKKLGQRWT